MIYIYVDQQQLDQYEIRKSSKILFILFCLLWIWC